ncbi:hypothetical protein AV955_gp025 [Diadromus pulchellus ascovirus 4a]|uniref:Complete DpAV4 genome n=1 Tax=Diadromus pulchellus ascovirus 4a TaxID=158683 RepID=F2NYV4_9VIRU|nr:hypothetical protein AV955_gp025 [Diadromus pulchellus ascovirus 4a]CCA61382.1 unnamed protein product [Diadromus pulchellus ascovirus 4a]
MIEILSSVCNVNTCFLKTLIDIMSQASSSDTLNPTPAIIKQVVFKFSKEGIEVTSDHNRRVFASASIFNTFFCEYEYKEDFPICIGISLEILKSCFKHVHKQDTVKMTISKEEFATFPNVIDFIINENKGFSIKFNIVQNIECDEQTSFEKIVSVSSTRVSNIFKELGNIRQNVSMSLATDQIKLSSNIINLAESWVSFPIPRRTKTNQIDTKSEYFKFLSKMAVFDERCDIFMETDTMNVVFETNIKNYRESKTKIFGRIRIGITNNVKA